MRWRAALWFFDFVWFAAMSNWSSSAFAEKASRAVCASGRSRMNAMMMVRIASSARILVPSRGGKSHNRDEFAAKSDLIAGANILLDVARKLSQ